MGLKLYQLIILFLYSVTTLVMTIYSIHYYILVFLNLPKQKGNRKDLNKIIEEYHLSKNEKDYPVVTIQLPVYNEIDVIERLLTTVVKVDYPHDKLEVQILDDSTDRTTDEIKRVIEFIKKDERYKDIEIKHIHRNNRHEYKAGALQNGLLQAKGKYLAIFDSDFIIPENFLKRTVPLIEEDEKIACVQTRWDYINRNENLITRIISVGIDGHFAIEQGARFYNNLFLNFNGTAGIWRKDAIIEAGGWQGDTLTEDLDISYRAQLKGYKIVYDFDTGCKSEIPNNIIDFKSQQYRWAKGSIQTLIKVFPQILRSKEISFLKKIEAFFHLSHYLLSLFVAFHCILTLPFLIFLPLHSMAFFLLPLWIFVILTSFAPLSLYMSSGFILKKPLFFIFHIPLLLIVGSSVCVNNSKAIIEAFLGIKSEFVRTPKTGTIGKIKRKSSYALTSSIIVSIIEILLGLYTIFTGLLLFKFKATFYIFFFIINALGFLISGFYSMIRSLFVKFRFRYS